MKWPRWLPHLTSELNPELVETHHPIKTTVKDRPGIRLGIRDVGHCEVCGRSMQARTRREEYRGRVDCDCSFRNHVEFRSVRSGSGVQLRHVTVTTGRRFEAAMHRPDLRLAWRYGICPSCTMAVSLADARAIAHEEVSGGTESFAYYCNACYVVDDLRRGRLLGNDGIQVIDTLRFQEHAAGQRAATSDQR